MGLARRAGQDQGPLGREGEPGRSLTGRWSQGGAIHAGFEGGVRPSMR
jgi:hypothetical protein